MKKKLLTLFLAAAMLLSVAGCNETQGGGGETTTPAPNNSGDNSDNSGNSGDNNGGNTDTDDAANEEGVLTIVTWGSNSDVKNMVDIFKKATGIGDDKIQIVTQGDDGAGGSTQIEQYLGGNEDADIITLEADWIRHYINDPNLTAPLSTINITEADFANPYSFTIPVAKNEEGTLMGATFQATPGGFCYNASLAEQYLGVKSPEEMQEKVKDWATFEATAKELYEASEGKCSLTATEGGMWQVYQANRTQAWVVDNKLVMDNAEQFYDIAKKFNDEKYMAGVPQWNNAWYAAVMDGTALGDFVPTWGMTGLPGSILGNFNGAVDEEGNPVSDVNVSGGNMAFCEGPQPYFWGGTWLGVAAKCNNPKLAEKFVRYFTCDDEGMKNYSLTTGDFCNNSKVMEEIVAEGHANEYLKDKQDTFAIFLPQAKDLNLDGLITQYDTAIKNAFNDSVQGYMDGTYASKEAAIEAFKDKVAETYPDLEID